MTLRRAALGVAVLLPCSALGQVEAVQSAVGELQRRELVPRALQEIPTQPSGFPGLPPKEGALPAPMPAGRPTLRIVRAGGLERDGNKIVATGGVEIEYRGYDIFAQEIRGDLSTDIFDAFGDVSLIGADVVVKGRHIRVNFRTETYLAEDSEAQLEPAFIQGPLLDTVYVQGKKVYGTERETFAEDSEYTTCNLEEPHYHVDAQHTTVRPGRRIIFRKLKVIILGREVLRIPYLSVPLNEPTYRYIPEFGHTTEEGYYVKSRWGIPLKGADDGNHLDARVDYFEKLGAGLGGDYRYAGKALSGLLTVYALSGATKTLDINNNHQQDFGWGRLTLDSSYQKSDPFAAPDSTLLSTRAQLMLPQGRNNTRLSLYRTENNSSGFRSDAQTIGVNDSRYLGALRTNLDLNWVSNKTSFSAGDPVQREQVDVRFTGEQDLKRATARLEYQRSIPVGEVDNFFSASDRTPVFSLQSDARRLFGDAAPYGFPFTTQLSIGEFVDSQSRDHITRSSFDLNFQRPDNSRNRARFNLNGRFRQGIYSDDTAQYILQLGTQFSYQLGRDTSLNLRYNYLRPYGFSPLSLDRTGKTNVISGDISFRPLRSLLIGAQTGYDILQLEQESETAWQNVSLRTEYRPTDYLNMRALSTYDTFNQVWSNIRLDVGYQPGATFVSLGARYDGVRHTWGNASLFVDGLKWGRLKTSAILEYNGFLKQFEARHFSFTYDLHCWEAILQVIDNPLGFRAGTQVVFFFRIKALPFLSPFGIGQRGQPLGTGSGIRF